MMRWIVWLMLVALVVLHQDYWQFHDGSVVYGFLPYGMAYHIYLSVVAMGIWLLAVKFCWPHKLVDSVEESQKTP